VNVEGRLCVADAAGPCGNPSSDSARTQISTQTERAAWIYFLPVGEDDLDQTAELVTRYGRGLVRMACSAFSAAESLEPASPERSPAAAGATWSSSTLSRWAQDPPPAPW